MAFPAQRLWLPRCVWRSPFTSRFKSLTACFSVGSDLFTRGGRGGKGRAYNFVGVACVCLYLFDSADNCRN